jgi:hypothetical protein
VGDPSLLDAQYPVAVYRPEHRVAFVLTQVMRAIMKESKAFTWMSNDGIDMLHAIMAVGSADIVALDKAWKPLHCRHPAAPMSSQPSRRSTLSSISSITPIHKVSLGGGTTCTLPAALTRSCGTSSGQSRPTKRRSRSYAGKGPA